MEDDIKKGFFKKVWYAINKIEKYPELSAEGFGKASKYLIILVMILAIISSIVTVYKTSQEINEIGEYIKENAQEFTYKEDVLSVNSEQPIINESEAFGKIIVDTNTETEEQENQYINSIGEQESGIIILKDKLILNEPGIEENAVYNYKELFQELNLNEFNKETLVQYMQSSQMMPLYLNLFLVLFIYAFMMQLINTVLYVIVISIFGHLVSMILRLRIRYVAILNMAIYSITLSVILNMLYLILNAFIEYRIAYFEVMYMLVATIYIIAALFILKIEANKKQEQVQKVIEVEKEVKQELEKQKQEEKNKKEKKKEEDKKKQKNKKDENGEEPEGSQA